jgi:hypothetical protein
MIIPFYNHATSSQFETGESPKQYPKRDIYPPAIFLGRILISWAKSRILRLEGKLWPFWGKAPRAIGFSPSLDFCHRSEGPQLLIKNRSAAASPQCGSVKTQPLSAVTAYK